MKKYKMIIYCFLYPILTMIFFMIWMVQFSTLPGGDIGMAPFLIGIILLIVFIIEIILVLLFKNKIDGKREKLISLIIGFFIYESIWCLLDKKIYFLESFTKPINENIEGEISFLSIFALLVIFILISNNDKLKIKLL
ncbi:hypothetical protein MY04_1210 [Flammeovirga sp. MY04]|uniref:hypothetical protein n=1 Tax=Flammeovirga sp. MY04 TaxID=1191459 RepID=UPI000824EFB3|nr:hypothetical protein [Flammeovirga sp. MY04]ANQ48587.2 hypothetical protein MY04_1210 [Flammeovirga sp. MY04]